MFIAYLLHKKSWIALILLLLLLTNVLIQVDAGLGVSPHSLIYLNVLFLSICILFVIWRYKKETAYYKTLANLADTVGEDWFENMEEPLSRKHYPDGVIYTFLHNIHQHDQNKYRELRAAQLMARDDLSSWVHELKTPLTAMKITMDANRSNTLTQRLNAPWLRMHLLIDRQLYISRLDNLEADLLPEAMTVQAMIRDEIRELATWCMEKNIAIDVTGSSEARVYTDKKWCGFVLRQLLTNAIKYSPTDGKVIIHTAHDDRQRVIVTVQDEGPGIAAHDLPRVFDKGFTGENGRVQQAATGMGLYLARAISEKLHIRLEVESTVGTGTAMKMMFSSEHANERLHRSLLDSSDPS